ncbi:RNA polymerase sigma factor [Fulvivirga maritima]|uniref:RNA polymerase sigma factor n=1 Tax=Fulvivirga maritima TaxID=2904247 RepID=UPI001F1D2512|nr:RNA polymerase sigma factor [Fulvivirga maritima]UII24479.1 RNA polymerase sigma factor [Fulvivirga maritima]
MEKSQKDVFITTLDKHKRIIYKIVNSYCKNPEDRKDLEQEIIIQLWNSFHKYNSDFQFSTWMYRIALNVAISFYRRERKRATVNDDYGQAIIHNIADESDYNEEQDQNVKLLQRFISELNELNKALMLLYLDGKAYEEIADILGITKTNVATKISRLKVKLKEEFQKHL